LVLLGQLSGGADDIFDQRCQLHGLWVELELPCLDLRQVEHLVDEAKKVSTSAMHALQRLLRLLRAETRRVGDQHVGQPDDGVKRRAELVAHAGNELRLMLAGQLKLAALVLDLAEQARILDREHRLGRERLQEINGTLGKVAWLFAPDYECSDDLVCAYQRHNKARTIAGPHRDLSQRARRLVAYIGDLLRLPVLGCLPDRIRGADLLVLHSCNQVFAKTIRGPQAK